MFKQQTILKAGSLSLLSLALTLPAQAEWEKGDSAPSVYLNYNGESGQCEYSDMMVNTIRADQSLINTYFASIGGGLTKVGEKTRAEGGYYMGIQETSTLGKKNIRFSIWNPRIYLNRKDGSNTSLSKGTYSIQEGETITSGNELIYKAEKDSRISITINNDIIKGIDEETADTLFTANEENSLTPDFQCPGSDFSRFTGEGRGGTCCLTKNNLWDLGTPYSFVAKVWEAGISKFGLWVFNHTKQEWMHLVTFRYPDSDMKFNSNFYSFVEDYSQNSSVPYATGKDAHQFHATNGWNRGIDGNWYFKKKAEVGQVGSDSVKNEGRCWKYYYNYDSGVDTDGFYLISGDTSTHPTNKYGSVLNHVAENPFANLTEPNFAPLSIKKFELVGDSISWEIASSGAPQFSCAYEVIDSMGNVVLSDTTINSERRSFPVSTETLNGSCRFVLKLTDIFDKVYTAEFTHNFSSEEEPCSQLLSSVTANSWGTMIDVPVNASSEIVELKIVNPDGELADASVVFGPQEMHGPHTHSLYLPTQFLSDNAQYFLVAKVGDQQCKAAFQKNFGLINDAQEISLDNIYADGNSVNFTITTPVAGDAYATVTTLEGIEIAKQYFYMNSGTNIYNLYAPIQSGATYILNVYSIGEPIQGKFIVK